MRITWRPCGGNSIGAHTEMADDKRHYEGTDLFHRVGVLQVLSKVRLFLLKDGNIETICDTLKSERFCKS